ncbi:Pam18 [Giardia muris]|uniref:Pam18 n=1 Tax=Giardia muris TaxID=5742 RepID=A0A4Z1T395_GIAMU|nr:Pam18 [Giardia muris]|eukprot:TNJ27527.1 Pam18 [Giardia muris]
MLSRVGISSVVGLAVGAVVHGALRHLPMDSPPKAIPTPLPASVARQVLHVSLLSNTTKIKKQYRALMSRNHPDRNGSPLLAATIGEAHAVLCSK